MDEVFLKDQESFRRATEWLAVGLPVLLMPVLLFPKPQWMWIALLVPAFWVLNLIICRRPVAQTPLNVFLLPLLLMAGVSIWASFSVEFSLGKLAGLLLGLVAFWGIAQFAQTEARVWAVVAVFFSGGLSVVAFALVGTHWGAKFPVLGQIAGYFPVRLKGLPGAEEGFNANPVGGSMILFLPLVLLLLPRSFSRFRSSRALLRFTLPAVITLAAFLFGGTLLISQSRGAWLGMASALVFVFLVRFRWARWPAVTAGVAGSIALWIYKPWTAYLQTDQSMLVNAEISFANRVEIWSRAIYGIQDFPFTGMGMNAFRKVVHILYPLFSMPPDVDFASAHNVILQTALDLGIPGMVAYVGIWAGTAILLWRVFHESSDELRRSIALGLLAGLLAQFVYQLTDAIPLGAKVGLFWWIALGIAVCLFRLEFPDFRRRARSWEILLLWVLISLVSISFVGDHPYLALAIGILGGVYCAWEATRESRGRLQSERRNQTQDRSEDAPVFRGHET